MNDTPSVAPAPETLSVADLIRDVRIAQTRMSQHNPHRALLAKCEMALVDVSFQLHRAATAAKSAAAAIAAPRSPAHRFMPSLTERISRDVADAEPEESGL